MQILCKPLHTPAIPTTSKPLLPLQTPAIQTRRKNLQTLANLCKPLQAHLQYRHQPNFGSSKYLFAYPKKKQVNKIYIDLKKTNLEFIRRVSAESNKDIMQSRHEASMAWWGTAKRKDLLITINNYL